ncbi:MAG: ABC transporter ATP-binding protein [Acidimicrobiales bacterium]
MDETTQAAPGKVVQGPDPSLGETTEPGKDQAGPAPISGRAPGPIVVVEDLVKRYPSRPVNAVDGVSFSVSQGEILGLLGPNGAGKTTTVGILTTRVRLTSGRATVAGINVVKDPVGARRELAVVPQRMNLDRALSARRNLLFHAAYFGLPTAERGRRADALLAEFGLAQRADDKVDRFSGGQAQRLMIARALMHEPKVLFLDEPTTGLDPQARLFVWDRIEALRDRGVTIVLTTHDMDEAATLADRVGIMDHGKLLALDRPAALTALVPGRSTLAATIQPPAAPETGPGAAAPESGEAKKLIGAVEGLRGVERVEQVAGTGGDLKLRIYCQAEAATMVTPVVQLATGLGATLGDLRLGEPSLEDVFIHLTGRELRG